MVTFKSGIYDKKDWNETVGTYTQAAIPDKDTALQVASAIFEGMAKNETEEKFVPQSVFYDEQDEIWIVSFWEPVDLSANEITTGYDCCIAMQRSDGKVLRIWVEE